MPLPSIVHKLATRHARSPASLPLAAALLLVSPAANARLTPEKLAQLPPATAREIRFSEDVRPILEASCIKCHGRGKNKGGFRLDTRATFLSPGDSGPAVVVGNSGNSLLIEMVSGLDPDNLMPKKGSKLTRDQVAILRAWIDQGLRWDDAVTFAKPDPRNFKPQSAPLPEGPATHPVDRFIDAVWKKDGFQARTIDDRRFLRRSSLDIIGVLPKPAEMDAFVADPTPDKRERWIDRLLGDKANYAQHWLTFWNDLLRNDYRGTGYIDGGRKPISQWLYAALRDNKPYDQFVRELVNPTDASEGFSKGIVWRGTVNASMTPAMQAAQNIGQVFMGVNLKCASCHDSFIDDWQLSDAYGLAGIYADGPLEMVQCDRPIGKFAPLQFLFPELGSIDAASPRNRRLEQLSRIITHPANGRLTRTVVNRLWARLLGRGLVEPLDVMQNEAWHPALLDWLAEDFAANGHDLKHTLRVILTSRAYQSESVDANERDTGTFAFRGPIVRRLTAEQFRDALSTITGVWAEKPEGGLDRLLLEPASRTPLPATAFWIWSDPHGASGVPPGTNWFRNDVVVSSPLAEATLLVHADNRARVWINGRSAQGTESPEWNQPSLYDLRSSLQPGTNVLEIEVVNTSDAPNPAGLLVYGRLRTTASSDGSHPRPGVARDFGSDGRWQASKQRPDAWPSSRPDWSGWSPAQILGPAGIAPWNLGETLANEVAARPVFGNVRASLTVSDPLMLALGRPNREQVMTTRAQTATTLQGLELTNGGTLSQLLRKGAEKLAADGISGRTLADRIFRTALGRTPTATELDLATELIGEKPSRDGLEDLLWSVAMLPEFQLIL